MFLLNLNIRRRFDPLMDDTPSVRRPIRTHADGQLLSSHHVITAVNIYHLLRF